MRMKKDRCPICSTELEVRDVSPCWDCGHDSAELIHLADGKHTYSEFEVFGSRIVLCDHCMVDFSSNDRQQLGLPQGKVIGLGTPEFREVRSVENPVVSKDKVCPTCNRRRAYLNWVTKVKGKML